MSSNYRRPSNNDDEDTALAKQMFLIGLLGLPWLWCVNCCYFYSKFANTECTYEFKKCK
jgi:hypothetical protein